MTDSFEQSTFQLQLSEGQTKILSISFGVITIDVELSNDTQLPRLSLLIFSLQTFLCSFSHCFQYLELTFPP